MMNKIKTVFIGQPRIGKTSIIRQATNGTFSEGEEPTIGAHNFDKVVTNQRGETVKFFLWDTAGQENFRSLVPMYFQNAVICVIVYDITDRSTFQALEEWYRIVKEKAPDDVIIVIVGNKLDLTEQRAVTFDEGLLYSHSISAEGFFEVSAKTGEGISHLISVLSEFNFSKGVVEAVPSIPNPVPQPQEKCPC